MLIYDFIVTSVFTKSGYRGIQIIKDCACLGMSFGHDQVNRTNVNGPWKRLDLLFESKSRYPCFPSEIWRNDRTDRSGIEKFEALLKTLRLEQHDFIIPNPVPAAFVEFICRLIGGLAY